MQARFDNIGGLKPRAPVRSAGVTVGRVTGIALDAKTFQGVVTMEIERGFQFPKDSAAKILTAGLLGDQYVGLEPGGDDKNLAPGDTIAQTQSAVVLENLIGQFLTGKAEREAGSGRGSRRAKPVTVRWRAAVLAPCCWPLRRRCATRAAPAAPARRRAANPVDPWENLNRKVFAFNEAVDEAVLKPVAEAYRDVVPQLVRTGVDNVLRQHRRRLVGRQPPAAGQAAGRRSRWACACSPTRFFGLGGLLDPATEMGLTRRSEDFGQTLGRWGVASGPYLVLPLLGPSTVRDAVGLLVDRQFSPAQLLEAAATARCAHRLHGTGQRRAPTCCRRRGCSTRWRWTGTLHPRRLPGAPARPGLRRRAADGGLRGRPGDEPPQRASRDAGAIAQAPGEPHAAAWRVMVWRPATAGRLSKGTPC